MTYVNRIYLFKPGDASGKKQFNWLSEVVYLDIDMIYMIYIMAWNKICVCMYESMKNVILYIRKQKWDFSHYVCEIQ